MEEALIKRILPHSIEAEQSVIGSMLMGREAIMAASEILTRSFKCGADFGECAPLCEHRQRESGAAPSH